MSRTYNREKNTAYHRARRERERAKFAALPKDPVQLEDDSNDTVTRVCRCGAKMYGVHLHHHGGELIVCQRGHELGAGEWTLRRVRPVESRMLPACDVSDVIVVEVLA